MNLRKAVVSAIAVAAVVLPTGALAADVHITIDLSHVQRDSGRKLKVAGQLHDVGGGPACTDGRHVLIQRRKNADADWNSIDHDMTSDSGAYKKVVADRTGQYRIVAPATASCEKDVSETTRHSH